MQLTRVVCNRTGANLFGGVVSAFVEAAGLAERVEADYACLEVDELEAEKIFRQLRPHVVVATNLFRDQLDRSGEVDRICEKLKEALRFAGNARFVYNGDDCLLRRIALGCGNPQAAYGIEESFLGEAFQTESREGRFCWFCGSKLEYKRIQYGQLGDCRCPGCGFGRPRPRYKASNIQCLETWYFFEMNGRLVLARTRSPYEVYNTLAAYSALRESGDPKPEGLVIQINDEVQDGRDVSWLWDVGFERLERSGVETVAVTGNRRYDMELRLKYANIPCLASEEPLKTVRELLRTGTGNLYVVVNYSGLYRTGRLLKKLQKAEKGKEKN